MKLQLSNPEFSPSFKIKHTDNLFFIGSCFAENLSRYFEKRKFNVLKNPFGIIYNPVSIANCIEQIAQQKVYDNKDLNFSDGLYASWHHHSNLASMDEDELKQKLQNINEGSFNFLTNTDVVFITLGTAWVYWHKELKVVVANNLKAPSNIFEKKLLSITEIENALSRTIRELRRIKKDVKIVFTLSPVRYSKQGLVENNQSKARLLEAIHNSCESDDNIVYCPTYEIVIDVLRDYRFFEQDLVHPNSLATDYIWDFLEGSLLIEEDKKLIDDLYNLHLAAEHIPRHPDSEQAIKFTTEQLQKTKDLLAKYPYLKLDKEIACFSKL